MLTLRAEYLKRKQTCRPTRNERQQKSSWWWVRQKRNSSRSRVWQDSFRKQCDDKRGYVRGGRWARLTLTLADSWTADNCVSREIWRCIICLSRTYLQKKWVWFFYISTHNSYLSWFKLKWFHISMIGSSPEFFGIGSNGSMWNLYEQVPKRA